MDRDILRRLLHAQQFRNLVAVRVIGSFADGLLQAALTSFVLFSPERAPTPAKILTAFGVLLLPYSVLGPFIGVVIDRWQRQRILIIATLARAACVLVVAGVVARGNDGRTLAFTVLATLGVGRFVLATLSAALPHVVDEDCLVGANSIAPPAGTLFSILGGLIGVTVATAMGGGDGTNVLLILTAAVGHLSAGLFATRIPRTLLGPDVVSKRSILEVLAWLSSGIQHMRRRPRAPLAIVMVSTHRIAFGGATLLILMLLRNTFHSAVDANAALAEFTFVVGLAGMGAFVGAVSTPPAAVRFGVVRWARAVLTLSAVVIGADFLYVTARPEAPGAFAAMLTASVFIGFAGQCVKISSDSVVQTTVDDEFRGRVFAIYDMALNFGIVGGTALTAALIPTNGRSPLMALLIGGFVLVAAVTPRV